MVAPLEWLPATPDGATVRVFSRVARAVVGSQAASSRRGGTDSGLPIVEEAARVSVFDATLAHPAGGRGNPRIEQYARRPPEAGVTKSGERRSPSRDPPSG